jgi:hypothetical protein
MPLSRKRFPVVESTERRPAQRSPRLSSSPPQRRRGGWTDERSRSECAARNVVAIDRNDRTVSCVLG